MKLKELKNKKILIVGAGVEGKATFNYLLHYFPDQRIDIIDQKDGSNYLQHIKQYDVIIKSPGIKPDILSVPYTTAANIFFANVAGMIIGVTGTKGKSTTASLIHAILQQSGRKSHLVGNIGNPMLEELIKKTSDGRVENKEDIWVCELSSYMTGDLQYSPHISVILNLFPEHMDYHGGVEEYYAAKMRIVSHTTEKDFLVYNPSFGQLVNLANETKAQAIPYIEGLPFPKDSIPLLGEHNYDNVRAAVTVANILHIKNEVIKEAVKNFKSLRHRLENVGTYKGIIFYDDAISTTPQSTIEAIKALKNIGTIFLGGQDRGYDFSELAKMIIDNKIPNVVLFRDSGSVILEAIKKRADWIPNIYQTDSMDSAIKFAFKHTKRNTICLHSPASPSYTLWKNFQERGDEFQKEVKEWGMRK